MTAPGDERERVVRELHSNYCDLDACYLAQGDPCSTIDAIELAFDAGVNRWLPDDHVVPAADERARIWSEAFTAGRQAGLEEAARVARETGTGDERIPPEDAWDRGWLEGCQQCEDTIRALLNGGDSGEAQPSTAPTGRET